MSWMCRDCNTKWPEAVPTCIGCLLEEISALKNVLDRLASHEGFEGALDLKHAGPDALSRELRARIMFAEKATGRA